MTDAPDDYEAPWQFRASAIGINGSHRSEHPEPAPRRVVGGERSGDAAGVGQGRPERFYEPSRFHRAKEVAITKVADGQYHAASQSRAGVVYVVNVVTMECECEDKWFAERVNGGKCKHLLAALLQERHPALFDALVESYEKQLTRLREAGLLEE